MSTTEQANNEGSGTKEEQSAGDVPAGKAGRVTVVGIGASTGGLAALLGFFDALPAGSGMAFVVVTRLGSKRESLLPEILQEDTVMPVQAVTAPPPLQAGHVYVISPNRRILITDTHLDSQAFEEPRGWHTPIDFFFRSLAGAHRAAGAGPMTRACMPGQTLG